ncbi:hypothetical protein ACHAXT_003112 [Thalassiosira profunda]
MRPRPLPSMRPAGRGGRNACLCLLVAIVGVVTMVLSLRGGGDTNIEPHPSDRKMQQGTQLRELTDPGTGFSALYYTPPASSEPLPLLLYLHGAGESGRNVRDLISEGATGTPPVELENGTALPVVAKRFIVVAPQTAAGWNGVKVNAFLNYLLSSESGLPKIDASRCYVTGHSMGGYGALETAAVKPSRWAAAVAVAPAGAPEPEQLAGTPTWCFHGKNDVVVPFGISKNLIEGLRAGGASEDSAKLTLYEQAPAPKGWDRYDGHGSPMPAYATHELWKWILEKRLGAE